MPLPSATYSRGMQNTGTLDLTGGTTPNGLVIRHFADFQKFLSPTETPFTSSLKTGAAVPQKKVEWLSSFLAPNTSALGAAIVGAGDATVTVQAGDGAKFMVTDVFQVDSEHFWVTAINGDVLTVKRGSDTNTTAVAHSNGAAIQILGPAALENADTPLAPVARGGTEYNYPQLFDYAIGLSNRENVTADYEIQKGNKYDYYLQKRMKEAAIHFEMSALLGRRSTEAAMTGAAATPTKFGGLDFFTDVSVDRAGAPITETALMDLVQARWNEVGADNTPTTLLVGGFVKRAISSLFNANRLSNVKDKETTLVWTSIETDFGPIRFRLSRYIPAGKAYLLNLGDITVHPYKDGAWKEVALPTAGPYKKGRFTGDYTLVFRNNLARAKMINISTNPAHYPNM